MLITVQTRLRNPENWPDQLREATDVIQRESRSSDAVVWLPTNRRALAVVYPHGFGGLRDITLAISPIKAENFGGVEVSPSSISIGLNDPAVTRVWLVDGEIPWRGPSLDSLNLSKINSLERKFRRIGFWWFNSLSLTLYEK
ncbi:hypothetical protein [Streptosporangium sp. NPDC051022]|uniref:hypothetical protein n=1 Tax=Streptosporangium sp. NPDC051022 TaxID=3155752 RepID=UPI003421C232